MVTTRVVNLRKEAYDVYIGRAGKGQSGYFGNPFPLQQYGAKRCLQLYRDHFYRRLNLDPDFKRNVLALRGKILGCFCAPGPCHGHVIVRYVDANGTEQLPFTHEAQGDRRDKWCECWKCGAVGVCTPLADFYTTPGRDELCCENCLTGVKAASSKPDARA